MERFIVIILAVAFGLTFFYWFTQAIKREKFQDFIGSNTWLLHPNSICYWRTAMALIALPLYFLFNQQSLAIFIFTFAAILDGVDGIVARKCDMGTVWGEWLDPMCDKLTYLPPLLCFGYAGILSTGLLWSLIAIEFFGQFLARHILRLLKTSGAANNFGKIKAIICFGLVIFAALRDANPWVINVGNETLIACIVLATASVVFKFIPNKLYADILSSLNFCCGVASLYFTHNHLFAWAICIIIVGQLFDLFDGRMAELHGGTRFGPLLDDVADFVSFGLAPAYVLAQSGGALSWYFGVAYFIGVAYRLIRFITVDKKKKDLPAGVFNGLPSPAGALVVLGASLVVHPDFLWLAALISMALMVSHIRFAHFGRILLKEIPRPVFFIVSASIVIVLAIVLKTKNAQMFGYLILTSVLIYMVVGKLWTTSNIGPPANE